MIVNPGKLKTRKIIELLKSLSHKNLNKDQIDSLNKIIMDTEEFVNYNEWRVGLECMCENLYEYSIPLTKEVVDQIKEACTMNKINDKYYFDLEELIQV